MSKNNFNFPNAILSVHTLSHIVEEQELGHHVVDLHMEEVENQDVDIYMVE